ncbi:MAG TPA: AAA family ATPase, partial [Candidatus Glassbacteria bacterium]|nr:AAA family ATPase [Candidatus Glassbacteria bacterium]
MLQTLRVTDFVLFDQIDIEFSERLNVITGETGAGKSILLGAVELILGGEISAARVRTGAEKTVVEGLFSISPERLRELTEMGIVDSETGSEIIVRREVSISGRSRCFINGNLANLGQLCRLGEELIQVHGQQEHQELVRGARQLELLDAFGALDGRRKEFSALLARWRECGRRLERLRQELENGRRESELARFQFDEITRAAISASEQEQLEEELNLLENAEKIGELAAGLLAGIEGEDGGLGISVMGELGALKRQFDSLAAIVQKAAPLVEQFDTARYSLEEVAAGLREIQAALDFDPARLDEVRDRLD